MKYLQRFLIVLVLISSGSFFTTLFSSSEDDLEDSRLMDPLRNQPKPPGLSIENNQNLLLENISWRDYSIDDDNNGLYNRLMVDLGRINNTGNIDGIYGVLRDSNGILIGKDRQGIQNGNITLSFAGQPIRANRVNGPFVVQAGVFTYEGWWELSEISFTVNYTTNAYQYTEFERPSAEITGFYDFGRDSDGDQYYDELVLRLNIHVVDPGQYDLRIYLGEASPFPGSTSGLDTYWNGFLTPRDEVIEVSFPTRDFTIRELSGTYNVSYTILSFYNVEHQYLTDPYTTKKYDLEEFGVHTASSTWRFWDWGVDSDIDGKFEGLVIVVEVNISEPRVYQYELAIHPVAKDDGDWDQWKEVERYFGKGIHNVTFEFETNSLYSLYENSSFEIIRFAIHDSWNYYFRAEYPYVTQIYNFTDFPEPIALFTGNYWDIPTDINADGRYEELVLIMEVNITFPSDFRFELEIVPFDQNGSMEEARRSFSISAQYPYSKGIQNISFSMSGEDIFRLHKDSSFRYEIVRIRDLFDRIHDIAYDVYTTQEYGYSQFRRPFVYFTGKYTDIGRDIDNNGLFEALIFSIEINVTAPGNYRLELSISPYQSNQRWIEGGYMDAQGQWGRGIHNINFSFGARYIFPLRLNTSFVITEAFVRHSQEYDLLDSVDTPYVTNRYHYRDFEVPTAFFTGRIWSTGVDTDLDGLINELLFTVEVNVTESAWIFVEFNVRPFINVWWSDFGGSSSSLMSKGVRNVTIPIYVTLAHSLGLDSAYEFWCEIFSDGNRIDWLEHPYVSQYYQYEEFDPPNAFLTGNIWDYGVDTDLNGKFDELVIACEVNVSQPALYHYELNLQEEEWRLDPDIIGLDESPDVVWEEGIHNISIVLPSPYLYLLFDDTSYFLWRLRLYDVQENLLDVLVHPYQTSIYSYSQFDPPDAYLTGIFWEIANNLDFDSEFEEIAITVMVSVNKAALYSLYVQIEIDFEDDDNYYDVTVITPEEFLESGRHEIPVVISSSRILSLPSAANQFTLHLRSIMIVDENLTVIHQLNDIFSSRTYTISDFDIVSVTIIPKQSIEDTIFSILIVASILVYFTGSYYRKKLE
ncbi:MAG: hypothetical protein ACFFFG_08710 [Candidatus Thorarchaeota archaeon]